MESLRFGMENAASRIRRISRIVLWATLLNFFLVFVLIHLDLNAELISFIEDYWGQPSFLLFLGGLTQAVCIGATTWALSRWRHDRPNLDKDISPD